MIGAMRKSIHTAEYAALCKELRAARNAAELSQRDMAARLKVPHSWVAKVEAGERRIDLIEFCWFISACDSNPLNVFERVARQVPTMRGKGGRQ